MYKMYNYPSEICEYCYCTHYGECSCETITPNGYYGCEGINCQEAYENYQEENPEDDRELEDMF